MEMLNVVAYHLGLPLETPFGNFEIGALETVNSATGRTAEHLVVYLSMDSRPLNVRINSACFTGDLFQDSRCDCNWQMIQFLREIQALKQGLLLYHLHHDGRGNGAVAKLRSYQAASSGHVGKLAYESLGLYAERRHYQSSGLILKHLGIESVNLFSNNPQKIEALESQGIIVESRVPLKSSDPSFEGYYRWKREDFNHDV